VADVNGVAEAEEASVGMELASGLIGLIGFD
jgi:hypothetical protein